MEHLRSQGPWGIPLLGLPGMTARPADEDGLAQLIQPFFAPGTLARRRSGEQFSSTISGLQIGDVALMAIGGNGLISRGFTTNGLSFVMACGQPGLFRVEGSDYLVDEQPFLLPRCPYEYRSEEVRGTVLSLDPARLITVATVMAGNTSSQFRQRLQATLQRPQLIDLAQGRNRQHYATLKHTLWLADRALRAGDGLSPMLALDDLLTRLVALLVFPELDTEGSASEVQPLLGSQPNSEPGDSDQTLHQLIDWMVSDLERPLRLSDLEAYSGYARRTLQKHFQRRFGIGPMQWLRRQRLLHARQLIETSGGQIKLGVIAQSCGYHNRASFSRDFHQVFGEKASDLVRRCTS